MRIDPSLSYPVLQFRSKSIIAYDQYVYERSGRQRSALIKSLEKVRKETPTYSGKMTTGAKKRLTKAISLLVQSSKQRQILNPVTRTYHSFKLSFMTLTIPEMTIKPEARFCNKNLLEPFLRVLRRKYNLKNYVWKLELQKNGMVHYHITSNLFILHTDVKNEWNNILRRNNMLEEFKKRTGVDDPNSTDIKSVKNVKNLEAYLVKYVIKDSQKSESIKTKVWDCSRNLKSSDYFVSHSTYEYQQRLRALENQGSVESYAGDRYVIFKFKGNPVYEILNKEEINKYIIHINNIRNAKEKNIAPTVPGLQPKELGNYRQSASKIKTALPYGLFTNSIDASRIPEGFQKGKKELQKRYYETFCK